MVWMDHARKTVRVAVRALLPCLPPMRENSAEAQLAALQRRAEGGGGEADESDSKRADHR